MSVHVETKMFKNFNQVFRKKENVFRTKYQLKSRAFSQLPEKKRNTPFNPHPISPNPKQLSNYY